MTRKPRSEFDMMLGYCLFLLVLFAIAGLCSCNNEMKKQSDHIYYTKYGALLCSDAQMNGCGLTLYGCMDDRSYVCLTDVAIK